MAAWIKTKDGGAIRFDQVTAVIVHEKGEQHEGRWRQTYSLVAICANHRFDLEPEFATREEASDRVSELLQNASEANPATGILLAYEDSGNEDSGTIRGFHS